MKSYWERLFLKEGDYMLFDTAKNLQSLFGKSYPTIQ